MTDIASIITEIEQLPHFHSFGCKKCSAPMRVHALQIYGRCPQCGVEHKCRSYGAIGTEIQDVIDAVLVWAGSGETFDAVMQRRTELLAKEDEG